MLMKKQGHLLKRNKGNLLRKVCHLTLMIAVSHDDVDFTKVAGLDERILIRNLKLDIASLKEMVIIPLLYPELFSNFQITPPRYAY